MNKDKRIEFFKGRLIEVRRSSCDEAIWGQSCCWIGSYSRSDGKMWGEGFVYESAEESLEAARQMVTWEIEQEEITNQFKELINHFKAKGFTHAAILDGLTTALHESGWRNEIILHLEKAVKAAKTSGNLP